ncbi:MAG: translation elongation factor Ts [Gammaproteobacteria bacterium]|nr:translation elongation factor Ts [Gammaproteobacteria bacterium]
MQVTATMVKELRERTGAGMMECKKALTDASGDMDAAIEQMRKSGQAKADKKASRIAAEGTTAIANNGKQAVIIEVNCETDFVAKDDQFQNFTNQLAELVLSSDLKTVEDLSAASLPNGQTVEQTRLELVTKIGENIKVRRFDKLSADTSVASYAHGKRIGVLVDHSGSDVVGKDIAMHIAASKPLCISESEVPADVLDKERDIAKAQAEASGKPAEIVEKMVLGKVNKFLKESTLLGQPFIKDDSLSVEKYLKGANASVTKFIRYEVGEGLEKRSENFADEVQKQIDDLKAKG